MQSPTEMPPRQLAQVKSPGCSPDRRSTRATRSRCPRLYCGIARAQRLTRKYYAWAWIHLAIFFGGLVGALIALGFD